ncbi:hypothetical protein [Corynebacterium pilosum]|uniref:N-acetyltransferase domain-containing protein n=1 Tax=Corynebacterium pilosum TaxID=35756 RepID=A0A376CJ45_9CORY|nr:hypothetical protein [Corynebacterium pilosum]STC68516.1 Uncharacterised protein [Corynebacterium pilosum]
MQIRDFQPSDTPFVFDLINEGFHVDHRFSSRVGTFLDIYLNSATLSATHFRIALIDDQPAGLLIGRIKGDPVLPGRLRKMGAIVRDLARIVPVFAREWPGIKDWLTEMIVSFGLMRDMQARNIEPDNEVILFVVGSETRGSGVGKALFQEFGEKAGEFYLYTDSLCTWPFYEKRGMRRVAQARRDSPLYEDPVDHFIYAY